MADNIQISTSPPVVSLIGEGLNFEFTSIRTWLKTKADLALKFTATQSAYEDNSFTLQLPGRLIEFTFKASPDQSGIQLSDWDSGTIAEFIDQVIGELRQVKYINDDYELTRTVAPGITFLARNEGPGYDIDLDETDITGFQSLGTTAGTNGSLPDDYKVFVAACEYVDGEFDAMALGEDLVPVSDANTAEDDVAEYLKDKLASVFTFPFSGTYAYQLDDACIRYFIRYAEYEDGLLQIIRNNYPEALYVVDGGLSRFDADNLETIGKSYFEYGEHDKRFLTWASQSKTTYPDSPERLYYLKQITADIDIVIKEIRATETTRTVGSIKADQYSVIEILCGLPELITGDISDLTSYEIWLQNADTDEIISEIRTFLVDHTEYLNKRVLFFKNSFGYHETITCTGDMQIGDVIKREEIQVMSDGHFRRKYSLTENIPKYELSTGWLTNQDHRDWLTDLLLSKDVFYVIGDFLLPVVVTNKKADKEEDLVFMRSMSIAFEPEYRDERYSSVNYVQEEVTLSLLRDGAILLRDGLALTRTTLE